MKMSGGHRKAGQSSQSVEGGKARAAGGWDKALQRMKAAKGVFRGAQDGGKRAFHDAIIITQSSSKLRVQGSELSGG